MFRLILLVIVIMIGSLLYVNKDDIYDVGASYLGSFREEAEVRIKSAADDGADRLNTAASDAFDKVMKHVEKKVDKQVGKLEERINKKTGEIIQGIADDVKDKVEVDL